MVLGKTLLTVIIGQALMGVGGAFWVPGSGVPDETLVSALNIFGVVFWYWANGGCICGYRRSGRSGILTTCTGMEGDITAGSAYRVCALDCLHHVIA